MIQLFEVLSLFTPLFCIFLYYSNQKLRTRLDRIEKIAEGHGLSISARAEVSAAQPTSKDRQTSEEKAPDPWSAARQPRAPVISAPETQPSVEPDAKAAPRPEPTGPGATGAVMDWLRVNWVYAVSALSLALAGIFAAQYAADHGMFPPAMRIAMAALLGCVFIGGGEVVRRRMGDEGETTTVYLPSVFSGAGIVTLFGAVLTARFLYGMIEAPMALGLLAGVACLSVALGWFYGPVLAAVGILGATAAPFVVGGEPGTPGLINAYFGLVGLAGLSINALRRWPHIDALALLAPYGASVFVYSAQPESVYALIIQSVVVALAAGVFVGGSLRPQLAGPSIALAAMRGADPKDAQRQAAAFGAWAAATVGLVMTGISGVEEMLLATAGLTLIFAAGAAWSRAGTGAVDLAISSGVGLFVLNLHWAVRPSDPTILPNVTYTSVIGFPEPGSFPILAPIYAMIAAAFITSAAAAMRSLGATGRAAQGWICGAALIGPGMLAMLELAKAPADQLGAMTWASVAMAFAAGATFVASRSARIEPEDHLRVSLAAAVAFSMIGMALFILLTEAALTIGLCVLLLGCVVFDDRFRLPALGWFAQAATLVVVYRAVADPGLEWALDASYWDLVFAYALPAMLVAAARVIIARPEMSMVRAALEGAVVVLAGTGLCLLIVRLARDLGGVPDGMNHWTLGLIASVWLLAMGSALWGAFAGREEKSKEEGRAQRLARSLRLVSGAIAGVVAGGALTVSVYAMNPLVDRGQEIWGIVGLSSLVLAYLVPGLILLGCAKVMRGIEKPIRQAAAALGGALVFLYACLSVAQFWRGNVLAGVPMTDGELWSYTALLIGVGSGLMLGALSRGSRNLRLVANGFLLVAIGKVFVIDAPDLEGLVRAASFLVLGLSLAGLAWANRWAAARGRDME